MFDVECGMVLEPMQGNRVSSRVDLGYTELLRKSCGDISVLLDL